MKLSLVSGMTVNEVQGTPRKRLEKERSGLLQVRVSALLKCQQLDLGQTSNVPVPASAQWKDGQHPSPGVRRVGGGGEGKTRAQNQRKT